MTRLPYVSVVIGAGDDPDQMTLDLDFSSMTSQDALRARVQIAAVMRTLEQWDDLTWKLARMTTDAMSERIKAEEKYVKGAK